MVFAYPSESLPISHTQVLVSVSRVLSTYRDPNELFRELGRVLRDVVSLSFMGAMVHDEGSRTPRLYALETFGREFIEPDPPLRPEETSLWPSYQEQRTIYIPFVEREPDFPRMIEFLKTVGARSHLSLPLTTPHRRIGAFALSSDLPDAYCEETIRLLKLVADLVALAVGDALALDGWQKMYGRLELALEVNNSVASNLDLRTLLQAISANIRRVMDCDMAGVALPDKDGKHVHMRGFDFPESRGFLNEQVPFALDGTPLERVFRHRETWFTGADTQYRKDHPDPEGLTNCCLVPLVSRDEARGVLVLARRDERSFQREDVEFLTRLSTPIAISIENALAYGQIASLKEQLDQEKIYLEDEIRSELNFQEIVGRSEAIRSVLHAVETVAASDSTVLILGETGTGKELIARAIHDLSERKKKPFVKLNCAAIPTGLLESELFGHERGAFTGAISQHIGRFELANNGTVFLDEIGDIPLELQPKLLRVLQEREFERLGSTRTLRSDARLIAATNRDLDEMVNDAKFRADLFYRLNVFPVRLPPLRERREDIPLLVRHFTQQFARRMNKNIERIPGATMNDLVKYHWPGNIRELQNVIERAVILSPGSVLLMPPAALSERRPANEVVAVAPETTARPQIRTVLEEAEREQILKALKESNWIVAGENGAARKLGLKRSTLQFRMQKLGIAKPAAN